MQSESKPCPGFRYGIVAWLMTGVYFKTGRVNRRPTDCFYLRQYVRFSRVISMN